MERRMESRKTIRGPGEKRRQAIMKAALELFLEKDYAEVSVDEIIRRSGGSKSSVYEYFGTKEGLLREIIRTMADEALGSTDMPFAEGMATREALTQMGISLCTKILNDQGIGLFRLAVSNVKRFPDLSRIFYEAGPKRTQNGLAEYLKREMDAGRLKSKNPTLASELFIGMLLVKDHIAMPVGYSAAPSKAKIRERVKDAVDVFMAAYGKEG